MPDIHACRVQAANLWGDADENPNKRKRKAPNVLMEAASKKAKRMSDDDPGDK